MAKGPNNPYRCVRPACANKQAGQLGFTNERGLTMHVARVHEGMGPGNVPKRTATEQCPYCGRRYTYIRSHIARSHPAMRGKELPVVPEPVVAAASTDVDVVGVVERLVQRPMSDEERAWIVRQVPSMSPYSEPDNFILEEPVEEAVVEVKSTVTIPSPSTHTMRVLPFVVMMDEDGGIWHCERVVEP